MGQLRIVDEDAPRPRFKGRARRGLDVTLRAMSDGGRREPIDEAFVALARIAADELDRACRDEEATAHVRAVLIGRCSAVFSALLEREGVDDDGDRFDQLYAALREHEDSGL